MCLVAAVGFYTVGRENTATMAVYAWLILTFATPFVVKPRNVPEVIMTAGNQLLFAVLVLGALAYNFFS